MSDTLNYRQVIARAIADEMRDDPDVFMIGEDIGAAGGAFKTSAGLFEEFGPRRVRDTPILASNCWCSSRRSDHGFASHR